MARPDYWIGEKRQSAIDFILDEIEQGNSLRTILSNRDKTALPSRKLFNEWLAEDKVLSDQYARSCDIRAELLFDEIIEIADIGDNESVARDRLRVDARKWALSKMLPKKYGDKLDIDHTTQGEKLIFTPINLDVKE